MFNQYGGEVTPSVVNINLITILTRNLINTRLIVLSQSLTDINQISSDAVTMSKCYFQFIIILGKKSFNTEAAVTLAGHFSLTWFSC